jgi:hypothetical protein
MSAKNSFNFSSISPFRYMVCSEGIPKFLPGDNMAIRLHATIVIPPNTGGTTKLLGGEVSFAHIRTWYSEKGKLDSMV